ncbi:MAG: DUF2207 domain-containing protein, partial [Bacilli bacterium]
MKKGWLKYLTFCFLSLITITNVEATNDYGNGLYTITNYDVNIKVNENNTFYITENIKTFFHVPRHGIIKTLPLENKLVRLDGTKSYNRAKITKIKTNVKNKIFNEKGNKVIKMGDANETLEGYQNYTISYLYNIGKDPCKNYDEFYFDIIGNGWDTTIDNITFTIEMPKEFDKTKIGFSSGKTGSTDSSNVTYQVMGNKIIGSFNKKLNIKEALTIRVELQEGYFVGAKTNFNFITLLSLILPLMFTIITFILWIKFGKDNKPIETV